MALALGVWVRGGSGIWCLEGSSIPRVSLGEAAMRLGKTLCRCDYLLCVCVHSMSVQKRE